MMNKIMDINGSAVDCANINYISPIKYIKTHEEKPQPAYSFEIYWKYGSALPLVIFSEMSSDKYDNDCIMIKDRFEKLRDKLIDSWRKIT